MTFPGPAWSGDAGIAVGGAVLVAVLVIGLVAGCSRGRTGLLLAGLVAVVVIGTLAVGVPDLGGPRDALAARLATIYAVVLPPTIAFVAGWLLARGTWFRRALVVGAAVLLLAAFPYAAAGAATAAALVSG